MPRRARSEPRLPWRRRRAVRVTLAVVGVVVLTAAGVAYWALDRYVIDHVEIGDVRSHEQQVRGTEPLATFPLDTFPADPAPPDAASAPDVTTAPSP
jgi:hypothetical protein